MKIGIDIDNCIANFDDTLLKIYLQHDKTLRNTGIVNANPAYIRRGMFDWTDEEEQSFYHANIEKVAQQLRPLRHAPEYIQQLKADGHEIYIITGRNNGEYTDPMALTQAWLSQYHIVYDQLIFTDAYNNHAKTEVCLAHHIDVMIEDSTSICLDLKAHGIKVLTMNTRYNQQNQTLDRVSTWKEIYTRITQPKQPTKQPKLNVILDTDTYNECDDQFALAYLLQSQDRFNIAAITIAPYHHDNRLSVMEGTEKSYQEVLKICHWLNFDPTGKVFKGATDFMVNGNTESNAAVNRIIEIAKQYDKTYVLAIGAITNVALAIKQDPTIINKIEVVWLGGHSFLSTHNQEYNFYQDVPAVRTVFESKVKLTVIPCQNVASNLRTSIYELQYYLKGKSALGDYLCQRFVNDGVHGQYERRVIWDIAVIAYMINPTWFTTQTVSCPIINDDTSYQFTNNRHPITFVTDLNVNQIYTDLFQKLGAAR